MLAARSDDAFHLDAAWFSCWSAGFGAKLGPVFDRHGLRLIEDRARIGPLGFARIRGATNPHSAHYDAAPDAHLPADLPARLFADGPSVLQFDYLAEDSALLVAARGWDGRVRIVPHALSPVVDCRCRYDRWLAARSKRIRQRLRSGGREAFGRLGMTTEFRTDDPTASDLFDRILSVERSGWKGRAGTAIGDNPDELRFYTALVREAAAAGALHVALLWHGERLAAFEFGVRGKRRLFLLKVGYDEEYADISVGYLLAAAHIERCFGDPRIDWYDKMGNGMSPAEYKMRFADRCDTLYRVTAYTPNLRGALLHAYDELRARAKAWRDASRQKAAG